MNNFNIMAGKVVGYWFLATSFLMVVGGLVWLAFTVAFTSHAAKAGGQIVAMQTRYGSHGDTEYAPVFSFDDTTGITHTQVCSISSSDFSYEVGEKVTVLYDPVRPIHSKIDSFSTIWFGPLALVGFGVISGSFCSVWLYAWTNRAKTANARINSQF